MLTMECDKELEAFISPVFLEVERDPFLINNSFINGTPSPKISEGVRLKEMKISLDQNFMTRVRRNLFITLRRWLFKRELQTRRDYVCVQLLSSKRDMGQDCHINRLFFG